MENEKTYWKPNRSSGITIDRGDHSKYPTGIVMIHIRPFKPGEKVSRTEEVVRDWIVDFDKDGNMIQIEVLNPSAHFPEEILNILPHEFVPTNEEPPDKGREDGA